ncbi:MAG: acyltransferase, partial [Bacilli bacterium]|nr:acyltransferase [Bacilli bacterium]
MQKKSITKINFIRVVALIGVLLYHLGFLKGGYLAVCTFFVLTGYLSIYSNYNKVFNIKTYYQKRIKKVYIPLLIVVFVTLASYIIIKENTYINYKREILSILFGYNNYWQLNAQFDYFTRHISSPFMHFWYIAIILQFDLIFPFILVGMKKIEKKIAKAIPYILLLLISIGSFFLFYKTSQTNLMNAYYNTITRIYSLTLGMLIGLFHTKYKPVIIRNKKIGNMIFYLYTIGILIFFIISNFQSKHFAIDMLIVTLLSLRLLDYSKNSNEKIPLEKIISFLSNISYEIYLVQYPIIYVLQKINSPIKYLIIIGLTIFLAYLLNVALTNKKNKIKIPLFLLFIGLTIYGGFTFIVAKDNTKEMNKLKSDLEKNQKIIEQRQKEFEKRKKEEETLWENTLNEYENGEKDIENKVRNMSIIGIGDSIMELAVNDLIKEFPNGYFDAKTNRRPSQVNDLLIDLKNKGLLGDVVLFNVGTNGEFYPRYTDQIMETLENRKVFWVNATHADYDDFNDRLNALAEKYNNIRIIDWVSVAKEHPEYLISDKVHPTVYGCKIYASTLYQAIYEEFLKEYREQKEIKLKEHEKEKEEKITFIGNDSLIGLYEDLIEEYKNADFIMESKLDKNTLRKELKKIENKNIILLLDRNNNINSDDYEDILKEYTENNIIIIDLKNTIKIKSKNIKVVNIKDHITKEDYEIDGIHINKKG